MNKIALSLGGSLCVAGAVTATLIKNEDLSFYLTLGLVVIGVLLMTYGARHKNKQ